MAANDNIFYVNTASILILTATGSLFGTSSWSSNAIVATSASWASASISSSYAITASFASTSGNSGTTLVTASMYQITSSWASQSLFSATSLSSSFASASISSSFTTTASFATTASYYNLFPKIKAGVLQSSSFSSSAGNPWTSSITFTTAFPTANYGVTVTGADARPWTVEQLSSSNFTISTNSTQVLSAPVYWQAIAVGESA